MDYNLHVIVVHFPVALLTLYSVIRLLPFQKFFPKVAWRDTERVLLFFGLLGAGAAFLTGDTARRMVMPSHDLIEAHKTFAILTVWLYGALLLGEIAAYMNEKRRKKNLPVVEITIIFEKILANKIFSWFLALAGLIALTITGAVGGVMTFGLTADPMAPHILKLLGLSL